MYNLDMVPQKALHFHIEAEKRNPKYVDRNYMVLEKYDGWYGYVDFVNGKSQGMRSKTGRLVPAWNLYNKQLDAIELERFPNCRIIFEAVIPGMQFHELNGLFNQKQRELSNVTFMTHDLVTVQNRNFKQRYFNLMDCHDEFVELPFFKRARPIAISGSPDLWEGFAENVIEKGGEGIIMKALDASYSPGKRNADILKIKCEITLDLLCIGIHEGEGKYQGTTGKLIVKDKKGQHFYISGMTDAERDEWWNCPSKVVGHVVEVQAMKWINGENLREARFKAIRFDKTEQDID